VRKTLKGGKSTISTQDERRVLGGAFLFKGGAKREEESLECAGKDFCFSGRRRM